MQGLAEARMTAQAVTDFLAQTREGTRLTVFCDRCTFYGERILSKTPRNRVQRVVLSSCCLHQQDDGEWLLTEKKKGGDSPLLAIQSA